LSTAQFLQLRKEAVMNDGLRVDNNTVPEAFYFDPSRQSNFQQLTTGAPAWLTNAGVQASGGGINSTYFLSGQLHSESTVFPGSTADRRTALYGRWGYRGLDRRLKITIAGLASQEANRLPVEDYTAYAFLAPNAPPFVDAAGAPQWGSPPLPFVNIPALIYNRYTGNVNAFLAHVSASYRLDEHLSLEGNLGFNQLGSKEQALTRIAGQDPNQSVGGSRYTVHNNYQYAMSEALGRWKGRVGPGRLEGLLGLNWQGWRSHYADLMDVGYPSDGQLDAGLGATVSFEDGNRVAYHYASLFGRINYDLAGKYLLSASWRREGSTRLGTRILEGDFASIGAAWIFSREKFVGAGSVLSFGKLRGSLGTTGNLLRENIDWALPGFAAKGPLPWELNYQAELGLELGFFHDKLLLSGTVSGSRTANQLLNAPPSPALPSQWYTNVPGLVIGNRALEFTVEANKLKLGPLVLQSALMLTVPQNRLLRWPGGLNGTAYANIFVVGRSLSVSRSYHFTGVDPMTGLYTFQTNDHSPMPGPADMIPDKGFEVHYYAGLSEALQYRRWQLQFVLDYRKQDGWNPLVALAWQNPPGMQAPYQLSNGPVEWLDHWRKPGDIASQQRVSSGQDPIAFARLQTWLASDAASIDASFLRVKSIGLSWSLPEQLLKRSGMKEARLYLRGENLWTLTRFPVTDPETQDPRVLPPMRSLTAGMRVSF
jgi:hypothetical protein